MPAITRRRSFVDRYTLSSHPPHLPLQHAQIPASLRPHLALSHRLQLLFDTAFPPANSPPPPHLTLQCFQRAVRDLDAPLNTLVSPLEHPEPPDLSYIHLSAEAQIPRLLVSMLARVIHFLNFAHPSVVPPSSIPPTWKPYIPLVKHPACPHILHPLIVNLLRAMNTLAASSDLLTIRLAEDRRLLPLLFSAIRVPNAVELSLALMEETLHSPPIRRDFDLSTIPSLPSIIHHLTPFQLGLFCRVLAPLVDERDLPLCGGDHCTGACALPSHIPSNDWQRIEPAADQLRLRRSYINASDRALRDRNHAVLLAIPGLLQKLVKLIAVPPAPRDELLLVDHAIRSGVFTLNFDFTDIIQEPPPQPTPLHASFVAVRGEQAADVVLQQHPVAGEEGGPNVVPAEPDFEVHADLQVVMDVQPMPAEQALQAGSEGMGAHAGNGNGGVGMNGHQAAAGDGHATPQAQATLTLAGHAEPEQGGGQGDMNDGVSLPNEDQIRRRVLYMVFRRLTGMDSKDSDLAGTQSWQVLDERIARAEKEHGKNCWDGKVFREKRRRSNMGTLGVDIRLAPGETHGIVDFTAVPSFFVETNGEGTPAGNENSQRVGAGGNHNEGVGGGQTSGSQAGAQAGQGDEDESVCPELSINGLLMSSHQVEVLFVLYSLLIGRRKCDVQEMLIEDGIFPALNRFCDALDWTDSGRETKTEESLKLHFIRLLHYMCDGLDTDTLDGRLNLLFSDQERERLRAIESGADTDVESTLLSSPTSPMSSPEVAVLGLNSLSLSSSPIEDSTDLMGVKQGGTKCSGGSLHPNSISSISLSLPCDNRRTTDQQTRTSPGFSPQTSPRTHHGKPAIQPSGKAAGQSVKEVREMDTNTSDQSAGIICKVTRVLTRNHGRLDPDSTRRHLLSGCIESYLRGASAAQKTLIAQEGLLVHLLQELSESTKMTGHVTQFRQTSFDLLGQLIKWNRSLFNLMNEMFRRDPKLLPSLLKAVSDRLVDSNVFIRSLVISLEKFRAEDYIASTFSDTAMPYDFENCLLWEFLETFRVRLLHDLLASVRVEDLNFENICCVNTTLILLVTTCGSEETLDLLLSDTLDLVLESVRMRDERHQSMFSLKPVDMFDNFVKLIDFWLSYYQYQSTDVASKELSSNIHFDRLVTMAVCLKERLPGLSVLVRRFAENSLLQ